MIGSRGYVFDWTGYLHQDRDSDFLQSPVSDLTISIRPAIAIKS